MNAHAGKWIPWIWGLLAVALLGGCSKDESLKSEPGPVPGPDRIEIRLSGGIALSDAGSKALASLPATRAVVDANHEADLRVSFARIDQNGADGGWPSYTTASVLGATCKGNAAGVTGATSIVFDVPQYYLVRETNNGTKLVGWYPQAEAAGGVVAWTIDGVSDVMLTDELEGNKNADARFGTAGKIFEFAHCLTQLKVWAYAVDEAAKNVWGTIPEGGIVLKSQFPTCKVELPATVTFEGIPADLALPAKKAADDGAIGYPLALPVAASFDEADAAACGYALVAPIAVGGTLTLSVATSEGGTRDVPLTLPAAGFGAGKAYDVVLKFTSTQITPQATISPWEEAGDRIEVIL
ncbi:hypothetical protein [Alistipes ihumii]|uniref:fimbrillin family protein n=1 Tax=Alistipes ihumii TaxID=1470347 RepID=UPI00266C65AD|nr:hypothetical protein [Alistipes ihumii]